MKSTKRLVSLIIYLFFIYLLYFFSRFLTHNQDCDDLIKPKKQKLEVDSDTSFEKCQFCKENFQNIKFYSGHLNKSSEEFIALTDEKLSLFTGDEQSIHEGDELPCHKVTP